MGANNPSNVYIIPPGQSSGNSLTVAAQAVQAGTQEGPDSPKWAAVSRAFKDAQSALDLIMNALRNPVPFQRTLSASPVELIVNDGSIANDAALCALMTTANQVTRCIMYVKASDAAIDLTFDITKNGTSIFNTPITIVHATAADTEITSTDLNPYPLQLLAGDKFKLNITSGSADWALTIQLET